ncbi:hypothetical protein LshimejAT787_1200700 [Lyophyllum shimeji]|uniref:Uncharacterized protein n=1 Tax=Lyophyllum shimeji TaxID=47721 RepID=A0A9P3PVW4_LYOSH|nr:hypothetical protein LshimejAT787_1200700 [Lyophyllum shimeji]
MPSDFDVDGYRDGVVKENQSGNQTRQIKTLPSPPIKLTTNLPLSGSGELKFIEGARKETVFAPNFHRRAFQKMRNNPA